MMDSPMMDALKKKKLGTLTLDIHQDDNGGLTAEVSQEPNGMEMAEEAMEDEGSEDVVGVEKSPMMKNPIAQTVDDDKVNEAEGKTLGGKIKLAMQKAKAMK